MNYGIIGDIHERYIWKQFVSDTMDKWIFLGDYVDSFTHDDKKCINNLLGIIQFKKDNPDKVVLLYGNHDMSYINGIYRCSGFQKSCAYQLSEIYKEHEKLFQVAYQVDNYLFTHAGISTKWFNWFKAEINYDEDISLAENLNQIQHTSKQWILHTVSRLRGGYHVAGGITWADKQETMEGIIPGFHQIVGHTAVPKIERVTKFMGTKYKDRSITYCDVLNVKDEYLKLEI